MIRSAWLSIGLVATIATFLIAQESEKAAAPATETSATATVQPSKTGTDALSGESSGKASNEVVADIWQTLPVGLDPTRIIDLALEDGWRNKQLKPTPSVDDAQFARRLYLDLVGRVPKQKELDGFLAETRSDKRSVLIDQLLETSEHASYLATTFDAILIGRTEVEQTKRRANAGWFEYLERAFRDNRPWNNVARELVLARPSTPEERGAIWYLHSRRDKPQDIAEAVSKDIFGVRIDCAQCHDHPLSAEIEQRHYWGLAAFFNRSKNIDSPKGPRVSESAVGGFSNFANLEGEAQPNKLVYLGDRLGDRQVDEPRPAAEAKEEDKDELYIPGVDGDPRVPKFSRREKFVDVVMKDHPHIGQAMANRLWCLMFGRGLVHPVDAIDSFHPASHPGLLNWLGRDFAASGYDIRRMIRCLANTRAYQLKSSAEEFSDPQWFAVGPTKPLTAEALHRSLIEVLDPEDLGTWNSLEQRVAFAKTFPDVMAEESQATVTQGLLLTNGQALNELASVKHSRLLRALDEIAEPQVQIERLFQSILGRAPDAEEREKCAAYISARGGRRTLALEGMAWALVTSAEFRFNH